ncbi:MAG: hypothetical protein ACQESP_07965 [Candidatus Muiribacteriota bacterium]
MDNQSEFIQDISLQVTKLIEQIEKTAGTELTYENYLSLKDKIVSLKSISAFYAEPSFASVFLKFEKFLIFLRDEKELNNKKIFLTMRHFLKEMLEVNNTKNLFKELPDIEIFLSSPVYYSNNFIKTFDALDKTSQSVKLNKYDILQFFLQFREFEKFVPECKSKEDLLKRWKQLADIFYEVAFTPASGFKKEVKNIKNHLVDENDIELEVEIYPLEDLFFWATEREFLRYFFQTTAQIITSLSFISQLNMRVDFHLNEDNLYMTIEFESNFSNIATNSEKIEQILTNKLSFAEFFNFSNVKSEVLEYFSQKVNFYGLRLLDLSFNKKRVKLKYFLPENFYVIC